MNDKVFPDGSADKESACSAGEAREEGSTPGRENPLEEEMVTHSRKLAWEMPWTEEPGGLQSTESRRIRHDWVTENTSEQ